MRKVLESLIDDIQSTGGLITFNDGLSAPATDPTWTDLGATVLEAHAALEKEGVSIRLYINEVEHASTDEL
jgi:hypothetical protein